MGKVPKPNIIWDPAHSNNYSNGRPGGSIGTRETFHHIVGSGASASATFKNPSRGASSHYSVGEDGKIRQHVDLRNTAWTDGNWQSNLISITVEHAGGHPSVPYTAKMYAAAAHLRAWLKENYGHIAAIRHRQVSRTGTVCPGNLNVEKIVKDADALIKKYNTTKPPKDTRPAWLKNRKAIPGGPITVYAHKNGLFLYNMNSLPKPVDTRRFPRNQSFKCSSYVDVSGKRYYFTESSTKTNAPNGILKTEVDKKPWTPPSKWEPMTEPRKLLAKEKVYVLDLDTMKKTGTPIEKDTPIDFVEKKSVDGKTYLRTKWSRDNKKNWGVLFDSLKEVPKATPQPEPLPTPDPETPDWVDSIVDVPNQTMYVIRDTLLIDLENGHPVLDKKGNEIRYKRGDVIKDVSAHTIISEETYYMTEYSFLETENGRWANASGIHSDDLSVDPVSVDPNLPEPNPDPTPTPQPGDDELNILQEILAGLLSLVDKVKDLITRKEKK